VWGGTVGYPSNSLASCTLKRTDRTDSGSHNSAKSSVTYKVDVNVLDRCGLPMLICMLPLTQWTVLHTGCYYKTLAYLPVPCLKTSTPTQWAVRAWMGHFLAGSTLAVEPSLARLHCCTFSVPPPSWLDSSPYKPQRLLWGDIGCRDVHRSQLCWWCRPSSQNASIDYRGSSAGSGCTEGRSPSFWPWSKLAEDKDPVHHWPSYC